MIDKRTLTATRHYQTNKRHIDPNYVTPQPHSGKAIIDYSTMNNNNIENNRIDVQLPYQWGADDEIVAIKNRREKSPETTELVSRRVELARPGATRLQLNRNQAEKITTQEDYSAH